MIPKMPSFPTGNAPVKSISPDWLRRLWRCVEYAMHHPTGDNQTIVRHGEYLSAKGGNGDAVAGAAAPAAGSAYRGPFAVEYHPEDNTVTVSDSLWPTSDVAGRVFLTNGQILYVAKSTLDVRNGAYWVVCLVLTASNNGGFAYQLAIGATDAIFPNAYEVISLALLYRTELEAPYNVVQYQFGDIRSGYRMTDYLGPFAVAYDRGNNSVTVFNSRYPADEAAGGVSACGQSIAVPKTTLSAPQNWTRFVVLLKLFLSNDRNLAYELFIADTYYFVTDQRDYEIIPLAEIYNDQGIAVVQYQHGHIRAGFGRVW